MLLVTATVKFKNLTTSSSATVDRWIEEENLVELIEIETIESCEPSEPSEIVSKNIQFF